MDLLNVIQAITAGICFYAGIMHLMIGWRSKPKKRGHLIVAAASLLFAAFSLGLLLLDAAVRVGSLGSYPLVDKASISFWYPLLAALFLAFLIFMSLRLSSQIVKAEKDAKRLIHELKKRAEERTAALSAANRALQEAEEKTEAANHAKSDFLTNMSHELLTPLTTILGFTQLMERDPDSSSRQMEQLETINRSGEHLLDLINDVLEMSRLEAGRAELVTTDFDLQRSLASLESILGERAEKKGLDLIFDIDVTVPHAIRSDEGKLRQVLINLLDNAIRFTKEGQVLLRVSAGNGDSGNTLHFEIEDSGVGIAAQELDRLFEPFSQAQIGHDLSRGTGLGLPISRQFVELLGGEITVHSEIGRGSTFSFDIEYELANAQEVEAKKPAQHVTGLAPGQPDYRIAVVDDNADDRLLLQQLLESVGFEVWAAANGQEALEIYRTWQPQLIWMDMRMPVMDGYEAARLIRERDEAKTVIVALTASSLENERARALEAGCDDLVRKPLKIARILETMTKHLGIEFVYQTAEAAPTLKERCDLKTGDMAPFPEGWLAALRGAAMRGRSDELGVLIVQIRPQHPAVAGALQAMVNERAFKQIAALAEAEEDHKQSLLDSGQDDSS